MADAKDGDSPPEKRMAGATWKGFWKPDDPRYRSRYSVGVGPQPRAAAPEPVRLVVTEHPMNGGLVFATEARARAVDQIRRAIANSRTWRDFKQAMPAAEYKTIADQIFEIDGRRLRLDGDFDAEQVPGYSEGDYPPWLQAEMEIVLPPDLLRKFGVPESTALNGSFVFLAPEHREEIVTQLRARGFTVEETTQLRFY